MTDPTGVYRIDITVNGGSISIVGNEVRTSWFDDTAPFNTPTVNFSANFPMSAITFEDMDNIDNNSSRDSFAADVAGSWTNFGNTGGTTGQYVLTQFPLNAPPATNRAGAAIDVSFADFISRGAVSNVVLNYGIPSDPNTAVEDNFTVTFEPATPTNNFNILVEDPETLGGTVKNIVSQYRFGATTVQIDQLTVNKDATPINVSAPGTISYDMSVFNAGPVALNGISVSDSLTQDGAGRTLASGPTFTGGDTDGDGEIDPNETWTYTASYNVTQSDIDNGADLVNVFAFDTAQFDPETDQASTTITQTPRIALVKTAAVNDGGDGRVDAGDTITYTYTATNEGNVSLFEVSVGETAGDFTGDGTLPTPAYDSGGQTLNGTGANNDLAVGGAAIVFEATYVIDQQDIVDGSVVNRALASATDFNGGPVTDPSDNASTANGANTPTTTPLAAEPSLTIAKVATDPTERAAGETVTYTYTVTNTGNVPINDVTVGDSHNGSGPAPTPGSESLLTDNAPNGDSTDAAANASWDALGPGDVITFTGTYVVTQTDVDTLQ
ncbi:MAG: hypothetical protein AAGJ70_10865 [Pseudomonadota bacterium]